MHFKGRSLTIKVAVLIAAVASFQVSPYKAVADSTAFGISASSDAQTFTVDFSDSDGFDGNVLLDVELWDAKRTRVFQYFETKDLSGKQSASLTQPITAGLPDGTYTIKGGIFSPNWATTYLWSENINTITVGAGNATVAKTAVAPALTFGATSTLDGSTFNTTFTSSSNMKGQYLFDVELWDQNNKRAFQYFNTMSVNAPSMTVSRDLPASIPAGKYTAKVGIFLPGWSTKLLWSENAGVVTVGAPAAPIAYNSSAVARDGSVHTDFTASRAISGSYLFDVELWDVNRKKVFQSFDTYNMTNTSTMSISRSIPSNLAPGTYTIKAGWFTPNWAKSLSWNDNAGTVTVGKTTTPTDNNSAPALPVETTTTTTPPSPAPVEPVTPSVPETTTTTAPVPTTTAPTTTTTTTTVAPVAPPATPNETVPSEPLTFSADATSDGANFTTNFRSSQDGAGRFLYDVELYDSNNKKVFQFFEIQDTDDRVATVTQLVPTNLPIGTYTVKAGVFSPDWSTKYLWSEKAGVVKVNANTAAIVNANGPAGTTGNWNMVFGDEFNGGALDTSKWTTCSRQMIWWKNTCMGHGSELQAYTNDNVNIVDFGNGSRGLRLSARKAGTWSFTHDNVPAGSPRWNSGMISTSPDTMGFNQPGYKPFDFKYGFYEVRMKSPKGKGFWPAAWAFPTDNNGPQELDLVEVLGHDTNTAYQTVHYPGGQSSIGNKSIDAADGFHTYGMDWQPDRISWYIDGKLARTQFTKAGSIPDKNMYLMLNFAVGGDWPGSPDGSTPGTGNMDVDWVKVWKR